MPRSPLMYALALALLTPSALLAQGAKVTSAVELARQADALKPGQWVWAPEVAPTGPVTVYVDLSRQIATIYRNGVRIGVSTVSTGKPGHETPTGVFVILQKDADHHSSLYNNAPMPYQERLTMDGVALHAGGLPGFPESHGCVHLPLEFSRLLFGITPMGGTVVIAGHAGAVAMTDAAGVLSPITTRGAGSDELPLPGDEPYRWTPEVSPAGPVTIIISRSDQRAVVLRNGVEIGRSRISIQDSDTQTHVLTLTRDAGARAQWITVGVPGHEAENDVPVNPAVIAEAKFPVKFLALLQGITVPGTTVLVTQSPILPETTGAKLTVMTGAGR